MTRQISLWEAMKWYLGLWKPTSQAVASINKGKIVILDLKPRPSDESYPEVDMVPTWLREAYKPSTSELLSDDTDTEKSSPPGYDTGIRGSWVINNDTEEAEDAKSDGDAEKEKQRRETIRSFIKDLPRFRPNQAKPASSTEEDEAADS
jgi:hypothetical protein